IASGNQLRRGAGKRSVAWAVEIAVRNRDCRCVSLIDERHVKVALAVKPIGEDLEPVRQALLEIESARITVGLWNRGITGPAILVIRAVYGSELGERQRCSILSSRNRIEIA